MWIELQTMTRRQFIVKTAIPRPAILDQDSPPMRVSLLGSIDGWQERKEE